MGYLRWPVWIVYASCGECLETTYQYLMSSSNSLVPNPSTPYCVISYLILGHFGGIIRDMVSYPCSPCNVNRQSTLPPCISVCSVSLWTIINGHLYNKKRVRKIVKIGHNADAFFTISHYVYSYWYIKFTSSSF